MPNMQANNKKSKEQIKKTNKKFYALVQLNAVRKV